MYEYIDFYHTFKSSEEDVSENQLREILSEVDLNKNGEVDMAEFLQVEVM